MIDIYASGDQSGLLYCVSIPEGREGPDLPLWPLLISPPGNKYPAVLGFQGT